MPRPELHVDLPKMLAQIQQRLASIERREAYIDKRQVIANAGGLSAIPVPLVAPDASGYYSVTTSTYTQFAQFVGAAAPSLWVLVATNGVSGDFTAQLIFPNDSGRVMATSAFVETHATLGPVHRVAFTKDTVLGAATGAYATTITLQAKTANSGVTNKFRVIAAGWGSANV